MATSLFSTLGQRALHTFSSQHYSNQKHSSRTPTDPSPDPKLDAFESQLAQKLEELKEDSPGTGTGRPLTIGWLCKAMDAVLSTHAAAEAFIPDLRQALGGRGSDTKWLDEYLDDSVKLLDTVRALLDVVSEMKTYRANVDLAVDTLEHKNKFGLRRARVTLHRCVDALRRKEEGANHHMGQGHGSSSSSRSRLEHCSSMLKRMGEKLRLEDANKGSSSIFRVIYASQVTTIFICGVLASALSFKPKPSCPSIFVGGNSPWSQSLRSLQLKVKEHIEKTKSKGNVAAFVLDEVNKSDMAVRSLSVKLDKPMLGVKPSSAPECGTDVSHDIAVLKARSIELQRALAPLEASIDEVFKVLVTSRVALLNIYSHRKQ